MINDAIWGEKGEKIGFHHLTISVVMTPDFHELIGGEFA